MSNLPAIFSILVRDMFVNCLISPNFPRKVEEKFASFV